MTSVASGPSVAVIGGGISGLACANRLTQLGITNTTVFDTGKHGPGGRCSSRHIRIDGKVFTFDHSAQYFTVSDSRFSKVVSYLLRNSAVKEWRGKIGHLHRGRFTEDKSSSGKYVGVSGMEDISKCLARSLNMKTGTWVSNVLWEDSVKKWRVDRYGFFDYLVIAHNGKCADKLMSSAGASDVHQLTQVRFSDRLNLRDKRMQLCSIWALLVCFPTSLNLPFSGAHIDDEDLSWMANNTTKLQEESQPKLSPFECWTVFSTRQFGSRYKCPQENIPPKREREVKEKMLEAMKRVTEINTLPVPVHCYVQLWGAALPMNVFKSPEECVFDGFRNVGVCGDWLVSPCIQGAACSGLALAERINKHASGIDRKSTSLIPDFKVAQGGTIGDFPDDPSVHIPR